MFNFEKILAEYRDYLTFYHECRIPKHPFFDLDSNQVDERMLVVSSPSRMGNHLLMSMLDGHRELPSVPGEDGFHMFSFTRANFDIHSFMQDIRSESNIEAMMNIASNGGGSKWRGFSQIKNEQEASQKGYSGVGGHKVSAVVDFEDLVFDINYAAYKDFLDGHNERLRKAGGYNELLVTYAQALEKLNPNPTKSCYNSYLVHGAMRTQLLWLCQTMPNVRILSSVRSFPSYAVSQIKSRYGDVELTKKRLQEAWEHWYHKVIDILYLRLHFPEQFGLVTFDDLVEESGAAQQAICRFLKIDHDESMGSASIFGFPVKGNSWQSRTDKQSGQFYKPANHLSASQIPPEAAEIWDSVLATKLK